MNAHSKLNSIIDTFMPHTDPPKKPKNQVELQRDQYAGLVTNTLLTHAIAQSVSAVTGNADANSGASKRRALTRKFEKKLDDNDPAVNRALAEGEAISVLASVVPVEGKKLSLEEFLGGVPVNEPHKKEIVDSGSNDYVSTDYELREERLSEILVQAQGIQIFFEALLGLREQSHARVLSLLEILASACELPTYRLKTILDAARPARVNPLAKPLILTPSHGSCPSGHATQAYLFAHLLVILTRRERTDISNPDKDKDPLYQLASRIAENRVIAGVHFEQDSKVGRVLGIRCAEYLIDAMEVRFKSGEPSVLLALFKGAAIELTGKSSDAVQPPKAAQPEKRI